MSTLRLTTISNQDGSATVPSQTVISGSAKAWVNFNGTNTVAIRASFNVSSITDNGTGLYTANFTTALSDTNYTTVCGSANTGAGDGAWSVVNYYSTYGTGQQTTSVALASYSSGGSAQDQGYFFVAIFR